MGRKATLETPFSYASMGPTEAADMDRLLAQAMTGSVEMN